MIIVHGHLLISEGHREEFLKASSDAARSARQVPDCLDFAVSADTVDSNRVNIFEAWKTRRALDDFRGTGPESELGALIEQAVISESDIPDDPEY